MMEPKQETKGFCPEFDKRLQAIVFRVRDPDCYPFYLEDPENGLYKIERTKNGKVKMSK